MGENSIKQFKAHRYIFIDVLRGIAVLWMIETHVVDVVLNSVYKKGFLYELLNISNGFVAVTFLFCAGAGFWIAATRKAEAYRRFEPPLWQYLRRLGFILIIAYWLHFPTLSVRGLPYVTYERIVVALQCDILQTIVYSSLIALILLLTIKNLNTLKWIFGLLALTVFFLAPIILNLDPFSFLPTFFATLFAKYPVSRFPLFPWSGYFFAGAFFTALFFQYNDKEKLSKLLFFGGTIFLILFYITKDFDFLNYGYSKWWFASPFHSLFRISGTVMAFSFLFLTEKYYKDSKIGRALQLCGQESLLIYAGHLLITYSKVPNFSLKALVGSTLNPFSTTITIFLMSLVFYIIAFYWHKIKAINISLARLIIATFALIIIIFFFFIPIS